MAKKNFFNKIGNIMGLTTEEVEEFDGEEIETTEEKQYDTAEKVVKFSEIREKKEAPKKRASEQESSYSVEHIIVEPKYFEDVTRIADEIKDGNKMVTINISRLSKEEARRILDFVSGISYALDAKFTRVGRDVFQIIPGHIKQINEFEGNSDDEIYNSGLID